MHLKIADADLRGQDVSDHADRGPDRTAPGYGYRSRRLW